MVKSLLFRYMHKQIVIFVVYFFTMFANILPAAEVISKVFSLHEIMTQRKIDFRKDYKACFGLYVEASTEAVITNDVKSWTHKARKK